MDEGYENFPNPIAKIAEPKARDNLDELILIFFCSIELYLDLLKMS